MNDIQRRKSGAEDLSLKFVLTVFQAVWTLELGEFGEVIVEASGKPPIFITFGWSLGMIMSFSVLFTEDQVPQERPGQRPEHQECSERSASSKIQKLYDRSRYTSLVSPSHGTKKEAKSKPVVK